MGFFRPEISAGASQSGPGKADQDQEGGMVISATAASDPVSFPSSIFSFHTGLCPVPHHPCIFPHTAFDLTHSLCRLNSIRAPWLLAMFREFHKLCAIMEENLF